MSAAFVVLVTIVAVPFAVGCCTIGYWLGGLAAEVYIRVRHLDGAR